MNRHSATLGSVIVCGAVFLAVEHPLAKNGVANDGRVRCAMPRGNVLKAGQTWTHTGAIGVVPPGQLRRGFLYYLERRRAYPYRPFLHYNNWYGVYLGHPVERITEPECLEAVEIYGRELVNKRQVKFDGMGGGNVVTGAKGEVKEFESSTTQKFPCSADANA